MADYFERQTQKSRDITFTQHKLVEYGDVVYGVGILNVTEGEMRLLQEAVYQLRNMRKQRARTGKMPSDFNVMEKITLPLYGAIDQDAFMEAARQPEPDEPPDPIGDRFAGLDFGEDKK
jgi:hypothetical protein